MNNGHAIAHHAKGHPAMTTAYAYDIAADAPRGETYDTIKARKVNGTLGAWYAALTPRERVGVAALVAERTGAPISKAQRVLDGMAAAQPEPTPPARPAYSPTYFANLAAAGAGFEPHANDGTAGEWVSWGAEPATEPAPALPPVGALCDALHRLSAATPDEAMQRACGRAAQALVEGAAVAFDAAGDL
jgi:hypothetical protein